MVKEVLTWFALEVFECSYKLVAFDSDYCNVDTLKLEILDDSLIVCKHMDYFTGPQSLIKNGLVNIALSKEYDAR